MFLKRKNQGKVDESMVVQTNTKAAAYIRDKRKLASLLSEAESKAKVRKGEKGFVKETWEDIQLLFAMLKAYIKGEYKHIPYGSLVLIVGTVLYFVMPIDSIPDVLAVFGLTDDAALIAITMKKVKGDLERFVEWQDEQKEMKDEEDF